MNRRDFLRSMVGGAAALGMGSWALTGKSAAPKSQNPILKSPPNILFIMCDDLGIGDVHVYNPERGKIATPNFDALAAAGMRFTDAHSASALCTPTRYGVITGRYPWRSRMKNGVGGGFSQRLIEPGRLTVASMLKARGYATGCCGKWHLGLNWPLKEGGFAAGYEDGWNVDYTKPIQDGPLAVGFDYYFGISASLDMPPYVYIENDRVTQVPTLEKEWPVGPLRKGPTAAEFDAVDVLPKVTEKAIGFIERQAAPAREGKPFFLYLPLNAPHTPVIPTPDLRGRHELGWYGDYVTEVDRMVGKVLAALDQAGVADNTLVFFTSDNGYAPYVGRITKIEDTTGGREKVKELEALGHFPSIAMRGYKSDAWEGGHHIPLIVRWPGKVKPGTLYGETVCLTDLMATAAEIVGEKLPDNAGEDSVSILPALLGTAAGPVREATVHASGAGVLILRQGEWKLILSRGQDGKDFELYNLKDDPAETKNLAGARPEVVGRLKTLMTKYVREGRSTPGAPQKNTDPQAWPQLFWMEGYQGPSPKPETVSSQATQPKGWEQPKAVKSGKKAKKKKA